MKRCVTSSMPTQQLIARRCGISQSLVSRVLRGSTRLPVAPATRQRILQTAKEMDYFSERNLVARTRMGRRTDTIALVVAGMSRATFFQYAFYQQLLLGVEGEAGARGKHTIFSCVETLEKNLLEELYPKVDGLLLKGSLPKDFVKQVAAKKPVVLLATTVPEAQVSEVSDDGHAGIFSTTAYLVEQGHRHIAYALRDENPHNERFHQRYLGYRDALAASGLKIPASYETIPSTARLSSEIKSYAGLWDILWALKPRPTAIVCNADLTALQMMEAADSRGIRIPEQCSITGYDDVAEAARVRPSLTTVHVPYEELGRRAAQVLFGEIEKRQTPRQTIRLLPELKERASVVSVPAPSDTELTT
ncbi:MAG: LacI family DNA-binding transcriptional regulator [Verrucomicrobia bacterium]|nr:LacI family DNA-binding transcriptional regulator [Verrucomicrobiota bacterium]